MLKRCNGANNHEDGNLSNLPCPLCVTEPAQTPCLDLNLVLITQRKSSPTFRCLVLEVGRRDYQKTPFMLRGWPFWPTLSAKRNQAELTVVSEQASSAHNCTSGGGCRLPLGERRGCRGHKALLSWIEVLRNHLSISPSDQSIEKSVPLCEICSWIYPLFNPVPLKSPFSCLEHNNISAVLMRNAELPFSVYKANACWWAKYGEKWFSYTVLKWANQYMNWWIFSIVHIIYDFLRNWNIPHFFLHTFYFISKL